MLCHTYELNSINDRLSIAGLIKKTNRFNPFIFTLRFNDLIVIQLSLSIT